MVIRNYFIFVIGLFIALILSSCNEQGVLGDDIIGAQKVGIFIDTLPFTMVTRSSDSVETEGINTGVLAGRLKEDVFGEFKAGFYCQFSLERLDQTFDGAEIDSVFLELTYDTISYGKIEEDFDIYVYRMSSDPDLDQDKYSNTKLPVNPIAIGSLEGFIPEPVAIEQGDSTTTRVPGVLRIPLEQSFGEELLSYDSLAYTSFVDFHEKFKGVYVEGSESNESMIAFQLAVNYIKTRLVVFYRKGGDTLEFELRLSGDDLVLPVFEKDQGSAEISNYINDYLASEDYLFLSGLAGNHIEMDFAQAADFLEGKFINSAEVCLTANKSGFDHDYDFYPKLELLTALYETSNGLEPIADERDALIYGFNRYLIEDTTSMNEQFCLNITAQLQAIRRKDVDSKIDLYPLFQATAPSRIILNGVANQDNPARLKIYYSKTN